MPVTPFHFGPGALVKVVVPRAVSWTTFALANVLMDLEPVALFLLTGDPGHPWLHTLVGAGAVAITTALLGRRPCECFLRAWNHRLYAGWQRQYLAVDPHMTTMQAGAGALLGAFSHLLLDSVMHVDVSPLWPLIDGNPIQGWMTVDMLHELCTGSALLAGAIAAFLRAIRRPK